MAFGQFDDSRIKKIDIPYYGNINDDLTYQYSWSNSFHYSKVK